MTYLGRRLSATRKAMGFPNIEDFAELLGCEVKELEKIEAGRAEPDLHLLESIARVTGKTIDWLATGRANAAQ